MASLFVLLMLVAHAYGITNGGLEPGPWKIDKSHLAYSYSTQDKAASFNSHRYVPLSNQYLHTVRSPTAITPLSYGFKPLLPNVVYIQPKGSVSSGVIHATGKPFPHLAKYNYNSDRQEHARGPAYSFGPSAVSPTASTSFASPTPSIPNTYTVLGSSKPPSFVTKPPPSYTLAPPKPSEHYGPPQPSPSDNYGPPKPQPSENYGPPKPHPSDNYAPPKPIPHDNSYGPPPKQSSSDRYAPPSDSYGPPYNKGQETADINYGAPDLGYGPPAEYGPAPTPAPKSDEIKFIIYKPQNEEAIKETLIDHARETGDKIKFVHGPNLEINHDQKVYLPPPKKSIIYILLKEPEIHTKVQVMSRKEDADGAKPEVFIIYETTDGVIRKHYDLTEEESQKVVSALGDKMRLAKRDSEEDKSSSKESSTSAASSTPPSTASPTTPKST